MHEDILEGSHTNNFYFRKYPTGYRQQVLAKQSPVLVHG